MIEFKNKSENLIEVTITGSLHADDFKKFDKEIDELIKKHDNIRVMIDASDFSGWNDFAAAEEHFKFVKSHQDKIERLAVIAGHIWQHWLAAMAHIFIHPKVKVFNKDQKEDARTWLKQG